MRLATGAVVSGFAGLVSALASRSLASRASGLRSQQSDSYCYGNPNAYCTQLASDTHAQQSDYVASEVLYTAAAVLAVSAIGAWLLWPKGSTEAPAVTIAPAVVGRGVSFTLGGSLF